MLFCPVNPDSASSQPQAKFSRFVVLLIDALRADFVLPISTDDDENRRPQMEFVREKIAQNASFSFLAKAHPPTVTMPRIKVGISFFS